MRKCTLATCVKNKLKTCQRLESGMRKTRRLMHQESMREGELLQDTKEGRIREVSRLGVWLEGGGRTC